MMNKIVSSLVLAGVLTGTMASVSAAKFSYNFVEVSVAKVDIDGANNTYGIGGSYDINSNVNLLGAFTTTDAGTIDGVDLDINSYQLGIGYHTPIAESTDAVANISYVNLELEGSLGNATASVDESGYGAGVGVRHMFSDQLEGDASVDYIDINDFSDTSVSVGGRFHFNETISAGLGYTSGDEDTVSGTLRMSFL